MNELNAQELLAIDPDALLAMATEAQQGDATVVVMPGRQLAAQDVPQPQPQPQAQSVPKLAAPRKPRGQGKGKGAPLKNDLQDPSHLWAISGRKGPNGQGTVIFVQSHGAWAEIPRTKAKAFFAAMQGPCQARIHTEYAAKDERGQRVPESGQRMLLIG